MTLQKRVKNDSAKEVAMVKLTEEDVAVDAGAIQLLRCLLLANMCECVKISLDENKTSSLFSMADHYKHIL